MLTVRRFRRDWSGLPLHWLPGDVFASHVLNVLHLILPPGELWMCRLLNRALPLIDDVCLQADVKGMVGQEGAHASGHREVLTRYEQAGFDFSASRLRLHHMFNELLGDRLLGKYNLGKKGQRRWLLARLGVVAALEHITCALGSWAFYNEGLQRDGADSDMVALIKWQRVVVITCLPLALSCGHFCVISNRDFIRTQKPIRLLRSVFCNSYRSAM